MPFRYASKIPERFLNAGTERFKRFGKTQRYTFDVAVREDAVKKRMIESASCDLHTEVIANRKITGGQSAWVMLLIKEDGLSRTMQTPPLVHASLKRATCRIRKLSFVSLLQPLKQRLRFEPRFHFESLLHLVPYALEWVAASAIVAICCVPGRQSVVVAVVTCRFLAHFRHPC